MDPQPKKKTDPGRPRRSEPKSQPPPSASPPASASGTAEEVKRNLVILATGVGLEPPPEAGTKPPLDVSMPLEPLARELGMLSRGSLLFRRADSESYVTVDPATGKARPMDGLRFCSWVEAVAWPYRPGKSGPGFSRMPRETANLVMAADPFREHVRQLRGINQVRLPAWRGPREAPTIELLPAGWDETSGVFTLDHVQYDHDEEPMKARTWFLDTFGAFPFDDEQSRASFVLLMLTPYIRGLLPAGEKVLHGIYIANQPRSGKSLLAHATLAPVHGEAAAQSVDGNPEELRATLDAVALEGAAYLLLDDMGSLKNRTLNAFMTAPRYKARVKGFSRTEEVRLDTMVLITGNALEVGPEIAARCLFVDLWVTGEAGERTFAHTMTPPWLALPETRAKSLAFLWACVRNWRDHGMPRAQDATRPGFEAHANLAGSIVRAMLLGNAFEPRRQKLGGDGESAAIKALLMAAAERSWPNGEEWRPAGLVDLAEEHGLLDTICPWAKNPRQNLGHKIKLWRGRQLRDSKGRLFEFGHRYGHGGAIYPIVWIEE